MSYDTIASPGCDAQLVPDEGKATASRSLVAVASTTRLRSGRRLASLKARRTVRIRRLTMARLTRR
jgi:hypothetical protein